MRFNLKVTHQLASFEGSTAGQDPDNRAGPRDLGRIQTIRQDPDNGHDPDIWAGP